MKLENLAALGIRNDREDSIGLLGGKWKVDINEYHFHGCSHQTVLNTLRYIRDYGCTRLNVTIDTKSYDEDNFSGHIEIFTDCSVFLDGTENIDMCPYTPDMSYQWDVFEKFVNMCECAMLMSEGKYTFTIGDAFKADKVQSRRWYSEIIEEVKTRG